MSVRARTGARDPRALLILAMAAALSVVGWLWYTQPFREAARIGIDLAQLQRTGRCMSVRGRITCLTTVQPTLPPELVEQVDIDPWTRRLVQARRSWWMTDSTKWTASIDSIRRTAGAGPGSASPCDAANGFVVAETWTRGKRELRLYAVGPLVDRNEDRVIGKQWLINVRLVDQPPPGCISI